MGQEKDTDLKQFGLLCIVVVVGLGLTFFAARESWYSVERQQAANFQASAELYVERVRGNLFAGLTAAQDLYEYYQEVDRISPEEFSLLIRTNSNLNKNRRFVALSYRVTPENVTPFLAGMERLYEGEFKLRDGVVDDPATEETIQYPLLYIWAEDVAKTDHLLGLNLGSHRELQRFLDKAGLMAEPSVIFMPKYPEIDEGQNFLIMMANPFVSKGGNQGYIVQLIDFKGLLQSVDKGDRPFHSFLNLQISSQLPPYQYQVGFGEEVQGASSKAFQPYSEKIKFGASEWTLTVSPVLGAFPVNYGPVVITASVCLLLTGLFYFIVWSQSKRARRVADIVNRRTRALKEAHDELEEHYKLLQNLNKDVEEARRAAETANTAKSEFLATMSHELRTPLNAILGFSQLLSEQALGPIGDERYVEYSKDINVSGSHLLSLINDILDLAKLEAGKVNIEKKPLSTRQLTDRVITFLGQQAETKGIELYAEFEGNLPDNILGDELRLRQIMINLCTNAVKFTEEGSVVVRLFSKAFQNGRLGWILEVQDTGVGIPEEKQKNLFDRFTQVDAALSRRHGGVGLGLAICRELVDRMEGTITVRSIVNVGTTIRVHLPLEEAVGTEHEDDMMI